MDVLSIGAALSLADDAEKSAYAAAAAAREAAGLANKAKDDADDAASAANEAASAANAAAANYSNLDVDVKIDRTAFNLAWTGMQAEIRNLQKRLTAAEAALAALQ